MHSAAPSQMQPEGNPSATPAVAGRRQSPPGERFAHDFSRVPVQGTGGRRLPDPIRIDAEQRLHQPFDAVRLHDDSDAGWTALSFGARAVTIGNHIYAAPGQLEAGGRSLLMHEIAHVAAQDLGQGVRMAAAPVSHPAEEFARAFAAGRTASAPRAPVGIYHDPMLRTDFEQQMRRFGVGRIYDGTFQEQVQRLNYFSANARHGDLLQQASWTSWGPGADSSVYDWIMAAFTELAAAFGGVPPVRELAFYATDYRLDASSGSLVPEPDIVAEYGGGLMAIYETAVTRATSNVTPSGRSGGTKAASLQAATAEEGVKRTVSHELGHGLVETALTNQPGGAAPDAAMMDDYRREVGWTAGATPELYDGGVAAVQTALAAGTTPPAAHRITQSNWNDPRWVEQPMTSYMTTHPSEDFPEAVAAYVHTPQLLQQRSPRRFAFLDSRKAALIPYLTRDLSKLRLRLTDAELQKIIGGPKPAWMLPPPPPAPSTPKGPVQFGPGLRLEIRF